MSKESRVWPVPGDLCTARDRKTIIHGVMWVGPGTGFWDWDISTGATVAMSGTVGILISDVYFPWNRSGSKRRLAYVLFPHMIGWDDYGNYNVESGTP